MVYVALILLGLCLGSFVNALVWRLHQQSSAKSKKARKDLSIVNGRSMCPDCKHQLVTADLLPVISWVWLKGKCRYCSKPISWQYPVVEVVTAGLFVISYVFWPEPLRGGGLFGFAAWLPVLVALVALFVYDLKWMLLPNKITYPLLGFVLSVALVHGVVYERTLAYFGGLGLSAFIGGGLFYILFQVSSGKWIGGGDVKLGTVLGFVLADPAQALLMLFTASSLGTIVSLPLLATHRVKASSRIPFGPFLIVASIIVKIFGASIIAWYRRNFLLV